MSTWLCVYGGFAIAHFFALRFGFMMFTEGETEKENSQSIFDDLPPFLAKIQNVANKVFPDFEPQPTTSFSERLALHPFKVLLNGVRIVLTAVLMGILVILGLVLFPIPWAFIGYLYLRKLRKIRHQHQAHVAHV